MLLAVHDFDIGSDPEVCLMKLTLMVKSAFFAIISISLLTSCATREYRFYSGPPLPKNDVALFYRVGGCSIWYLRDERGEEQKFISYLTELYELLPGQYIADIRYRDFDVGNQVIWTTTGDDVRLKLNVQAGNIYIIYPEFIMGIPSIVKTWRPIIVNINDYNKEECVKYSRTMVRPIYCPNKDQIRKRATKYLQSERPIWKPRYLPH